MDQKLAGKVALVTGASRGLGRGISVQLAKQGAKVYITGRTVQPPQDNSLGGSLSETAEEINSNGGNCVAVQCDHKIDREIEKLFEQIENENNGQLDILVNNAYSAINFVFGNIDVPFWEQPITSWDEVNRVGLRNHYLCSVYAARLMVPKKGGLIVNISSGGGVVYTFGALYGIGKEACDRMAADCGLELKQHNVAFISLWPGYILTDNIRTFMPEEKGGATAESSLGDFHSDSFSTGESEEFPGQCIAALAVDPKLMKKAGKIHFTCDLAREYRLKDKEGCKPTDVRQVKFNLARWGYPTLSKFVPRFVRIPKWSISAIENKF